MARRDFRSRFFYICYWDGHRNIWKYEKVIDYEGKEINAKILLEDIRSIVTDFAVRQIIHNGFSTEITPLTRFYIIWRWNYQESNVEFDEAKKISQSIGLNLEKEWNKGFIKKRGKYLSILGPMKRNLEGIKDSEELIDILHYILLLWEKGEKVKIIEKLSTTIGNKEILYRVAQAISQSLSNNSQEKKLIDGFLSGKERIKESIKESKIHDKIDRWTK